MAAQKCLAFRSIDSVGGLNRLHKYRCKDDKKHSGISNSYFIAMKSLQKLQFLYDVDSGKGETNIMLKSVSRADQAQAQLNLQSCGCLRSPLCSPRASSRWRHRTRIKETQKQNTQAYWCCKPDGYSSGSLGNCSGCWPRAGCKQELISWPASAW